MKMEFRHLPFICQRVRSSQESLNQIIDDGPPLMVSPLYLPRKRLVHKFDFKNVKGPGNLAREHLGMKIDSKELDDVAEAPPLPVPPPVPSVLIPQTQQQRILQRKQLQQQQPVKEEFPKQIQEVMLCSQQAHTEWEKAGKPQAPHQAYLAKMEIANILKGMIDQYLAFKAASQAALASGRKKKSRWQTNADGIPLVASLPAPEAILGPQTANPMGVKVAKPQAFVTKTPVFALAEMSHDQVEMEEDAIFYLEAAYVDGKPLFFEDVMDYFSNFGEIKW